MLIHLHARGRSNIPPRFHATVSQDLFLATQYEICVSGSGQKAKRLVKNHMRSSKSRSRSKNNNNRNRSVGNIVNRVFDSSGPEGKVRGTPQQIIDKYTQLARDAQLANDRINAENFQQHAEHYTRLLNEGMREMEARREQQERDQRDRQRKQEENNANQQRRNNNDDTRPQEAEPQSAPAVADPVVADPADAEQPDIIESAPQGDSGLVETPEETKPKRAPRRRKPKPVEPAEPVAEETSEPDATPEAAAE